MQRALIAFVLGLGPVLAAGLAYADGPGGSSEHQCASAGEESGSQQHGTHEDAPCDETVYTNDVRCGDEDDVAGVDVFAGPGGFEVCNDDEDLPLQGRVMASFDAASGSAFAGADGDRDNPSPTDGWIGVTTEAGTPIACGQRDDAGTVTSPGLDHATEEDDVWDCPGLDGPPVAGSR